jgi:hypothetical protein
VNLGGPSSSACFHVTHDSSTTLEQSTSDRSRIEDRGSRIEDRPRAATSTSGPHVLTLLLYGDEPGILVQRSRIDVQLQGTRTFIRDASRAEVAP